MRYYIDTEFLEGPQKEKFPISLFRKETPNTIDLISIGIVAEDGREYYAISKDFNLKEAWNRFDLVQQSGDMRNVFPEGKKEYWIRENVLKPIWRELFFKYDDCLGLSNKQIDSYSKSILSGQHDKHFSFESLKILINKYGKTNKEIAEEIKKFTSVVQDFNDKTTGHYLKTNVDYSMPEFYAYYADYDWVVFCWLFGRMIDLPNGFPMYCKDLKQVLDKKEADLKSENGITIKGPYVESVGAFESFHFKSIKDIPNYPKQDQSKSHNAIEDARWNKQLYEFLNSF